jgi:hypothetical protein
MSEAKMKTMNIELTLERDDGSRYAKTLGGFDRVLAVLARVASAVSVVNGTLGPTRN